MGASMKEIKKAYKYTEDIKNEHFDERLPDTERKKLLKAQDELTAQVQQFEGGPGQIEGVYMDRLAPS